MKTVAITAGFTGYPAGKKRHFAKGDEPELSNEFADLLVDKGLARELPAKAAPAHHSAPVADHLKDDK